MLAAAGLLAAPSVVRAQAAERVRRIGVLSVSVGNSEQAQNSRLTFFAAMRAAGYEEGRNLAVEWRYADGDVTRLPALALELVQLKVELIVASFNDAIGAARRATTAVPIVMFNALNPVEEGFVASLARPGGNVTGIAWGAPEIAAKILEVLKEAAPRARRIAFLGNKAMRGVHAFGVSTAEAAGTLGVDSKFFGAEHPGEVPQALEAVAVFRPQALYIALETVIASRLREVVEFTQRYRLPAISNVAVFPEAGGMLSYGPSLRELGERLIELVVRVLAGARPAELPVELPTKFELIVNLKTAKLIGHRLPKTFLARADRVIE